MNEFTKREADLVQKICNMVEHVANANVIAYADIDDWDAAAQAVIELVKEKLSEHAKVIKEKT